LRWGLPLLLVVAAAAIYFAVRPRPTQLAGAPIGPVILESRGHLVGAPVSLADGEVFLLMRQVGRADTPPPLFAVRGDGCGLVRLKYWDWEMPCPDFYFLDGVTSRGGNDMLVFAYCQGTRHAEVAVLDPARTAVERWGEFEAVAGAAVADDGTGLISARSLGAHAFRFSVALPAGGTRLSSQVRRRRAANAVLTSPGRCSSALPGRRVSMLCKGGRSGWRTTAAGWLSGSCRLT
jgi:hypothetical protein